VPKDLRCSTAEAGNETVTGTGGTNSRADGAIGPVEQGLPMHPQHSARPKRQLMCSANVGNDERTNADRKAGGTEREGEKSGE
jgi:hypothetical protein